MAGRHQTRKEPKWEFPDEGGSFCKELRQKRRRCIGGGDTFVAGVQQAKGTGRLGVEGWQGPGTVSTGVHAAT